MPSLYQNDKVNSRHFFTFSDIYQTGKNGQDAAMTNAEIRRENARWLAKNSGGPTQFAEMLDLSESRVSQLIGKNPVKNIGTATARKIETVFDKPTGWLDIPNAWVTEEKQTTLPVNAADFARLAILFGESSELGREQILRAAELADKLPKS